MLPNKKLRLAVAGTPEPAALILRRLLEQPNYSVELTLTQPDRPAGRGRKLTESPVKELASERELTILQPTAATLPKIKERLSEIDVMVVVAYGILLTSDILNAPRCGCINVHASLLPRWRGAAPVQRALQAGDSQTGVSIMHMDAGLDTGAVLLQRSLLIKPGETAGELQSRLIAVGGDCLSEVLDAIASDHKLSASEQDDSMASYAHKISKDEARIDWSRPAVEIDRMVRAFNPAPVCHTELLGVTLRIWKTRARDVDSGETPGTLLSCGRDGVKVATGRGTLEILRLQAQGKRVMSALDFLNGNPTFSKWLTRQMSAT